jgi:hypothetical protein
MTGLDSLVRLRALRLRLAMRRFYAARDRAALGAEISAVVFTVDPNPLLDRCLASVRRQSIPPACIEVVRNEMPASKASQVGLERVRTPFYLSVDGDMVLHPRCIERLFFEMQRAPGCAESIGALEDPYLGPIIGVRLYRTEPVRAIGFHPLTGEKGHDRRMTQRLQEAGHAVVNCRAILGLHHPEYTPEEAYWKFKVTGEKLRHYPDFRPSFEETARRLALAWTERGDEIALYGLAGLFDGIGAEDVQQELTYEGRSTHPPFLRLRGYLEGRRGRKAG